MTHFVEIHASFVQIEKDSGECFSEKLTVRCPLPANKFLSLKSRSQFFN